MNPNYLRWEQEVRRKRLRSPRGRLRKAIEEDYHAPPGHDERWWDEETKQAELSLDEEVSIEGTLLVDDEQEAEEGYGNSPERELWSGVLRDVEGQVTRATFQTLLAQTSLVRVQEDVVIVSVPTTSVQERIEHHLQRHLANSLEHRLGRPVRLFFVSLQK